MLFTSVPWSAMPASYLSWMWYSCSAERFVTRFFSSSAIGLRSTHFELVFERARHQALDRRARRLAVVEDGVYLFGDGHLDAAPRGEEPDGARGADALGD